jgi:hypothetical protein
MFRNNLNLQFIVCQGGVLKKLFFICILTVAVTALHAEVSVKFHGFPWGTSMEEFTTAMGEPASVDEFNGFKSLVYQNIVVSGFPTFMLAYFSNNGLQGGTYYFHTFTLDELMKCYSVVQRELYEKYGPTMLFDGIIREMRPYESSWNLKGGYIYLKVNTRRNEPVTLWYSSPELSRVLFGS